MMEWFLPSGEREAYKSQIMEGPHGGGGGPLDPQFVGWLWGFLFGAIAVVMVLGAVFAFS